MFAAEVVDAVGPTQYGVSRPGGPVALRHRIEAALALDPSLAVVAIDIANMHGSMGLANIENQVCHRIPRMWPLLAPWFRLPRRHTYKDRSGVLHTITATTGVDQGCPGSSTLACLGIAPLHEALAEHGMVVGLQDDTYLLLSQDRLKDGLEAIAPALAPTGCCLKLSKCSAYSPGSFSAGNSGIQRGNDYPQVLRLPLGRHDGTNYVMDYPPDSIDKIASSRRWMFERLQDLTSAGLSAQLAVDLARSATTGDSVYLQQCQPLTLVHGQSLDAILLDGITGLLGIDSSEVANVLEQERWFFPWRDGGYGLASVRHSSNANYLSAWIRDLPLIAEHLDRAGPDLLLEQSPVLCASLCSILGQLDAQSSLDLPALSSTVLQEAGETKLASKWRASVVTRTKQTFESGATDAQVTAMRESGGRGAGLWLALPTQPSHHLTDQEFTTACRLRMSLDIFRRDPHQSSTCKRRGGQRTGYRVCQAQLDLSGLHALLCNLGGHVISRHNRIRDILARLVQGQVSSTVLTEQHTGQDIDNRHPDISFQDHNGRRHHIDVEIVTTHPRSLVGTSTVQRAGALIETGEATKRRKYSHVSLLPAVMSHLGRFGEGFQSLVRTASRQPEDSQRSAAIAAMYQDIGAELQRANVVLLGAAGPLI